MMTASTARRPRHPRLPVVEEVLGGRFEVLGMLGEGGMGHVFRVLDRQRGREVALKLLTPRYLGRPEREARFLRELEFGTRAEHHRHLVEVLEGGRLDRHDWPFLVMERVPGRDLASRLVHGALEPPLATRLARQVAGAIRALHRAGVVHRDVTTMNVLVHEEDAVLIDLSHAGEVAAPQLGMGHRRLTRDHEVPGTPHAMAPEQARAEPAHPAMDVYAFGVMLVHMLTGTAPEACEREAFIELQREGMVRPPRIDTRVYREVPLVLAELVDACTGADPGRRPTMDEVVGRLDALLVVMPVAAADPSGPVPAANEGVSAEDVVVRGVEGEEA
ncbi:MAG: serine/threonine protein kinase, partial [Myxococcales bacterium]|nr:serine/threonine protein kinase [Myxococcales bacterium]